MDRHVEDKPLTFKEVVLIISIIPVIGIALTLLIVAFLLLI